MTDENHGKPPGVDVRAHNRAAWDREVDKGNRWTQPVDAATIAAARAGTWHIVLTPTVPVPADWFPNLKGSRVLCLASGGGQQGPILAAVGADVTVFDNSPRQLRGDRSVAERDGLTIATVEGDMADLSSFGDESFDLIVHPCSNGCTPDVRPVWQEAFRVLRSGGELLSGIANPAIYLFNEDEANRTGVLQARHRLPYADTESWMERIELGETLEYSHTLQDQIGGQINAGFVLTGFYEDPYEGAEDPLTAYMSCYLATRAHKP